MQSNSTFRYDVKTGFRPVDDRYVGTYEVSEPQGDRLALLHVDEGREAREFSNITDARADAVQRAKAWIAGRRVS